MVERTLVLVKPDGVQRGLTGEILKRFENVGLKIVAMKMTWINEMFAEKHYSDIKARHGQKIFDGLMEMITMGPVVAVVLEGVGAVEVVRKICGTTEPKTALPGTIRGDFAHVSIAYSNEVNQAVRNVVHASGNIEEAKNEIALWFIPEEIHDYMSMNDMHILHYDSNFLKAMKGNKIKE
jgi:nucleoside-diphosphate kinase